MKRLLVTGATGFIGNHFVREASKQGLHCRCLLRDSSNAAVLSDTSAEIVRGDLSRAETYTDALRDIDTVFHLAGLTHATDRAELFRVNADACRVLADACASMPTPPKVVYVSSLAAAGPPPDRKSFRDEEDLPQPVSLYGESKRAGEKAFAARADRVATTVLRPGVVYGPGDQNFAEMIRSIYRYRVHVVIGFRTPPLSLVYVDDVVTAMLAAGERGEVLHPSDELSSQGYYFICDDREYPNYWQFGKLAARALRVRIVVWPLWRWVGRGVGFASESIARVRGRSSLVTVDKIREATARSWACSSEKARTQLNFQPQRTLQQNLERSAQWYVDNQWV